MAKRKSITLDAMAQLKCVQDTSCQVPLPFLHNFNDEYQKIYALENKSVFAQAKSIFEVFGSLCF